MGRNKNNEWIDDHINGVTWHHPDDKPVIGGNGNWLDDCDQ